jgi:cytosine/adenosine deaminase-related metal-dependent hydrolase
MARRVLAVMAEPMLLSQRPERVIDQRMVTLAGAHAPASRLRAGSVNEAKRACFQALTPSCSHFFVHTHPQLLHVRCFSCLATSPAALHFTSDFTHSTDPR